MSLKMEIHDYEKRRAQDVQSRVEALDRLVTGAGVQAVLFDRNSSPVQQRLLGASGLILYKPGEKGKQINNANEMVTDAPSVAVQHWAPHSKTVDLIDCLSRQDIVAWVGEKGRLGVVEPDTMRANLVEFLEKALPDVELVDLTAAFTAEMAKKSELEAELGQLAARRHDRVFCAIPAFLNEGTFERSIVLKIQETASNISDRACDSYFGALTDLYSGKDGEWDTNEQPLYPGRSLSAGDLVQVKLQAGIAGGYYSAVGRCFSLGEPSETVKAAHRISVLAADAAARLLTPGSSVAKAADAAKAVIAEAGYETPEMCNIYAVGAQYAEIPFSNGAGADLPLGENTILAVGFPVFKGEKAFPVACWDAFLVREGGAVRLGTVERDILVV